MYFGTHAEFQAQNMIEKIVNEVSSVLFHHHVERHAVAPCSYSFKKKQQQRFARVSSRPP